jgi:hypothetical protein
MGLEAGLDFLDLQGAKAGGLGGCPRRPGPKRRRGGQDDPGDEEKSGSRFHPFSSWPNFDPYSFPRGGEAYVRGDWNVKVG